MYLLNMPVNNRKAKRYENREVKKLNDEIERITIKPLPTILPIDKTISLVITLPVMFSSLLYSFTTFMDKILYPLLIES